MLASSVVNDSAAAARAFVKYKLALPSAISFVPNTTTPVWPLTLSTAATELIIPVAES